MNLPREPQSIGPPHAGGIAAIQPHGVLLVIAADTLSIVQLAGDTGQVVGLPPDRLLGQPAATVLGAALAGRLQRHLAEGHRASGYLGAWPAPAAAGARWDVTVQRQGHHLLLEFEPAAPRTAAEALAAVAEATGAIEAAPDLPALYAAATRQMRRLTGFNRVVLYRFLADGSGMVVAEDRDAHLAALLDHHFPASDVPPPARAQYLRHRLRLVADIAGAASPLVPDRPVDGGAPPQLGDCILRCASPAQVRYLGGLGVAASMSLALVVDGALWGLIACHHDRPRHLPYDVREGCRQVGRVLSQQIGAREEHAYRGEAARLARTRAAVLARAREDLAGGRPICIDAATLASVVPCEGVAIVHAGRLQRHGRTPDIPQLEALLAWLRERTAGTERIFASARLVDDYPAGRALAGPASGVLAMVARGPDGHTAVWFRPEQPATIVWAGDPGSSGPAGEPPMRDASAHWEETVRHTATEWTEAEIDAVRQLADALESVHQQQKLQELNGRLRQALAEQESLVAQKSLLMQEVHHRVQNSLQIAHSILQLQARATHLPEARAQFEAAGSRLMAIGAVHQHLWRDSDMLDVHFGSYLTQLCADLQASWGDGWAGQVHVATPEHTVVGSGTAVALALIVTELLTNAVKYAYGGAPGPIGVCVRERLASGELEVAVSDSGHGIGTGGGGLGSTLVRTLSGQLGGRIDTASDRSGTTVTVTVPLAPPARPAPAAHSAA